MILWFKALDSMKETWKQQKCHLHANEFTLNNKSEHLAGILPMVVDSHLAPNHLEAGFPSHVFSTCNDLHCMYCSFYSHYMTAPGLSWIISSKENIDEVNNIFLCISVTYQEILGMPYYKLVESTIIPQVIYSKNVITQSRNRLFLKTFISSTKLVAWNSEWVKAGVLLDKLYFLLVLFVENGCKGHQDSQPWKSQHRAGH